MISSEAQRTLVKSPPELWAELSDPATLAQHLNELGEVRVIGTEPERTVEWEASSASGKIELSPSGWGTKVKLLLQREPPPAPEEEDEEEAPAPLQESAGPEAREPQDSKAAEPLTCERAVPETSSEQGIEEPATTRARFRFLARLFRRRRTETKAQAPESLPTPVPAPIDEAVAPDAPPPITGQQEEAPSELATELLCVEEELAAADTQLLNGILDRLGAAHHRPFSRA